MKRFEVCLDTAQTDRWTNGCVVDEYINATMIDHEVVIECSTLLRCIINIKTMKT